MSDIGAVGHIGVVIIGRNEGERLLRCLASIGPVAAPIAGVVYVDSGSTDASVANAIRAGAGIVELDMTLPFTAARARNAGRAALPPQCRIIQFIDGDCMLQPGWLAQAQAALDADAACLAAAARSRPGPVCIIGCAMSNGLCRRARRGISAATSCCARRRSTRPAATPPK